MHTHKIPVVLLKRLETKSPRLIRAAITTPVAGPSRSVASRSGRVCHKIAQAPMERFSMRLRHLSSPPHDSTLHQKTIRRRILPLPSKKRAAQPNAESSDVDDDKPLKYFAKTVRRSESLQGTASTDGPSRIPVTKSLHGRSVQPSGLIKSKKIQPKTRNEASSVELIKRVEQVGPVRRVGRPPRTRGPETRAAAKAGQNTMTKTKLLTIKKNKFTNRKPAVEMFKKPKALSRPLLPIATQSNTASPEKNSLNSEPPKENRRPENKKRRQTRNTPKLADNCNYEPPNRDNLSEFVAPNSEGNSSIPETGSKSPVVIENVPDTIDPPTSPEPNSWERLSIPKQPDSNETTSSSHNQVPQGCSDPNIDGKNKQALTDYLALLAMEQDKVTPPLVYEEDNEMPVDVVAPNEQNDTIVPNEIICPIAPNERICPMARYTTFKEILVAPDSEMNWCENNCRQCIRVNKVRRLRPLVDVYEFKAEREENELEVSSFRSGQARRGTRPFAPAPSLTISSTLISNTSSATAVTTLSDARSSTCSAVTPTPAVDDFDPNISTLTPVQQVPTTCCADNASASADNATHANPVFIPPNKPVYLDCLPKNSLYMVKLEFVNGMMRSRLIRKSQCDLTKDSLVEDQDWLDQVKESDLLNLLHQSDLELDVKHTTKPKRKKAGYYIVVNGSSDESQEEEDVPSQSVAGRRRRTQSSFRPATRSGSASAAACAPIPAGPSLPSTAQSSSTASGSAATSTSFCASTKVHTPVSIIATTPNSAPALATVPDCVPVPTISPIISCSLPTSRSRVLNAEPPSFSDESEGSRVIDAPVFYPTEAEFNDPVAYFERIAPGAAKFGLCKVVPPGGFQPACVLGDEARFNVVNQYIARVYSRWGPAAREMCAIKAYLASQSVTFNRPPLFEGIEVNLPKLYHIVQRNGGLRKVIEKKRWGRVAEEMRFTKGPNPEKRVDQLYVKYLLPYDTLSNQERNEMMKAVERCWNKKNQKMLERATNPLHRQRRLLGESDSSDEDTEDEATVAHALAEAEDCVVSGRNMNLATFKKVAAQVMNTQFRNNQQPTPSEVEKEYWRLVLMGIDHVCVNSASIDTGEQGYGFTKNKGDPYGKHPWNLKMVSQNQGNVLRSLGPVLGVTVPTLHLGMLFSTSCWHRDPHGLPWVEYMHEGPGKIWYGIPDEQSDRFRKAVEVLCPTSCQNKSIWLPSDITMIPPHLLCEQNVSLTRVVQSPGEFIIVFPKAYSSSIATGFTKSESVYFATTSWLKSVPQVFQEVRESCEPTMFSLEQLLLGVAQDARAPLRAVACVLSSLAACVHEELSARHELALQLPTQTNANRIRPKKRTAGSSWNVREQSECEICRSTLYLSQVTGLAGKGSAVCLPHARRLLAAAPASTPPPSAALVLFCSEQELQDALSAAGARLDV